MGTVLYRVERIGSEELGFPVPLAEALKQVRRRVPKETEGALRIARVEYDLDPSKPPTIHTPAMRRCWRGIVVKFPDVGWLGTYVCKPLQHGRGGNATDWAAPRDAQDDEEIISYLWKVARWSRSQGVLFTESDGESGLPFSEVIFRDKISTRERDWRWRDYDGTLHASHVHDSAYPLRLPGECD